MKKFSCAILCSTTLHQEIEDKNIFEGRSRTVIACRTSAQWSAWCVSLKHAQPRLGP